MQAYSKVKICGVDTSKLPRLKNAEMNELIQKIKAGSSEAEEKFIYALPDGGKRRMIYFR